MRISEKYCDIKLGQESIISAALMEGEEVELSVTDKEEWDITYDREPPKV